ncbi:MAG: Na+/H+ antiporter subunit E [Candidatus Accumulibacter sp.]|uniref:Na+/H+ antiporter subunit E n=1 Tax=Accumulibacter sp. TaxID=2053492 RepID=UPI0028791B72|nr:Na+/H+ antiporter subunit E [Accumulibacter sp.]MDS4013580.1 Na+/H+ antiporter subunit E [Accumulibacter sp.]
MLPAALRRGAGFAFLWLLFSEGNLDAVWLGAIAVILATAASLRLMPPRHYLRPRAVLAFAFFFLRNSVVSGLQVALLALDPGRHPRPRCIDVMLTLPEGAPRLIVAGALGLMPGTLSVRLDGAMLHVHAIDADIPVAAEAAALEAQVARMIGVAP